MLSIAVPVDSPFIVESKSVKLYLGSFAQTRFDDAAQVVDTIERDLAVAAGAHVAIAVLARAAASRRSRAFRSTSAEVAIDRYEVDASLLRTHGRSRQRDVALGSLPLRLPGDRPTRLRIDRHHLSRSAHRPRGAACATSSRFDCTQDSTSTAPSASSSTWSRACACESLTVHARFTRRGGLDINPFRTNAGDRGARERAHASASSAWTRSADRSSRSPAIRSSTVSTHAAATSATRSCSWMPGASSTAGPAADDAAAPARGHARSRNTRTRSSRPASSIATSTIRSFRSSAPAASRSSTGCRATRSSPRSDSRRRATRARSRAPTCARTCATASRRRRCSARCTQCPPTCCSTKRARSTCA